MGVEGCRFKTDFCDEECFLKVVFSGQATEGGYRMPEDLNNPFSRGNGPYWSVNSWNKFCENFLGVECVSSPDLSEHISKVTADKMARRELIND